MPKNKKNRKAFVKNEQQRRWSGIEGAAPSFVRGRENEGNKRKEAKSRKKCVVLKRDARKRKWRGKQLKREGMGGGEYVCLQDLDCRSCRELMGNGLMGKWCSAGLEMLELDLTLAPGVGG